MYVVLDLQDVGLPPPGSQLLLQASYRRRNCCGLAAAAAGNPCPAPCALLTRRARAPPLQGMEGGTPVLQLADGTRLVGAFQETVGDQLFLTDTLNPDGSHQVQLVGHSDKRITFSKETAAQGEEEGEDSGGAAAGRGGAAAAPS